jgi:ABC-2 type transport system ATP-binding protein
MLKLHHVSKSFARGRSKAIDDLTFLAKPGQIVGLLGPNGAGKTTTMRLITSYFFPDAGEILLDDASTTTQTLLTQAQIGYLPENNPLYPEMLVADFLRYTLDLGANQELLKLSAAQKLRHLAAQAKAVNLETKLLKKIGELSKGYRQRVGLAAALINDPKVVILDEPTEGLDPNEREEIRNLIKKLAKVRVILISTHVLSEVKALCNQAIVINQGRVVVAGNPEHLTGKYQLDLEIEGSKLETELAKIVNTKKGDQIIWHEKRNKIKHLSISSTADVRPALNKLVAKHKWLIWRLNTADELDQVFKSIKN